MNENISKVFSAERNEGSAGKLHCAYGQYVWEASIQTAEEIDLQKPVNLRVVRGSCGGYTLDVVNGDCATLS